MSVKIEFTIVGNTTEKRHTPTIKIRLGIVTPLSNVSLSLGDCLDGFIAVVRGDYRHLNITLKIVEPKLTLGICFFQMIAKNRP